MVLGDRTSRLTLRWTPRGFEGALKGEHESSIVVQGGLKLKKSKLKTHFKSLVLGTNMSQACQLFCFSRKLQFENG